MTRWEKAAFIALMVIMAVMVVMTGMTLAQANGSHTLTVDGTVYQPTKIVGSGPTVHYYTPGNTGDHGRPPGYAYTERHIWTGNGSGNLPCEGTLHWIDNANVLVISHCEYETGTTTTTVTTPTTTTLPSTTTTTQVVRTTTTTTTAPTTSTTVVGSTTTTTQAGASTTTTLTLCGKGGDAPCGGVATGGGAMAGQLAPEPIITCNGSGVRQIVGVIVFGGGILALALLAGLVGRAIWRGRLERG